MKRLPVLLVLLASAGCVTLPESGPVTTVPGVVANAPPGIFDYQPEPPKPGDEPATIVRGFLDALRETPLTFGVAREYLTATGATSWAPSSRTIVYEDGSLTTEVAVDSATVTLGSTVEFDARGSWLGDPSGGRPTTFELHLVREDDEWRIADPPDALIVSRTHFETRFVRYNLHFLDPTAQVLVPEPVYVPAGSLATTRLVSGLLAGPDPSLRTVERTFFPAGTRLELTVPVEDGIADVALSPQILQTDTAQLDLAMAQLAWTLRQVPGIDQMRVTVDGAPVERVTGASARSLLGWSAYDPTVSSADDGLYALAGRQVVTIGEDGPVAATVLPRPGVRSFAVSLGVAEELRVAAVSTDGRRVVSRPFATDGYRPREVYAGTDVLRPAYDRFDNVWLLDRTARGARLVVAPPQGKARELEVPALTGADVTAFALSRDGTRIAAVADGIVVICRISRTEAGRPTRAHAARPIPLGEGTGRAVDVAWTAPSTLGVLVRIGPTISRVHLASVDGSFLLNAEGSLEPLFEPAVDLVTWPGSGAPVYLETPSGDRYEVSSTGHWTRVSLPATLRALTFAG